ncbi:MAG: hypothetical protein RIQ53_4005 [Pseudomonadota bacterium]
MRWDLFCRVIDNWGDIGVCWRLAARLGAAGHTVRLWLDDDRALPWLAPAGAPGVEVRPWPAYGAAGPVWPEPGDVVVEAFGCDPPAGFVSAMAAMAAQTTQPTPGADSRRAPVWINLEYLSAEPYVERSHGLASPQWHGPGAGLTKWFFYPGFTARTGGLVQGDIAPDLRQQAHDRLRAHGWQVQAGERSALLFAYDARPVPALLASLMRGGLGPRLLLRVAASGTLQDDVDRLLDVVRAPGERIGRARSAPGLRVLRLPPVAQTDFDLLLAASDLNLVRGEDSFARAQLVSAAPLLWQIYVQDDGAHAAKLDAWMRCAGLPPAATAWQRAWNGLGPLPQEPQEPQTQGLQTQEPRTPAATDWAAWAEAAAGHHRRLRADDCLVTRLTAFVAERRARAPG